MGKGCAKGLQSPICRPQLPCVCAHRDGVAGKGGRHLWASEPGDGHVACFLPMLALEQEPQPGQEHSERWKGGRFDAGDTRIGAGRVYLEVRAARGQLSPVRGFRADTL
jgi:hypothetical protein